MRSSCKILSNPNVFCNELPRKPLAPPHQAPPQAISSTIDWSSQSVTVPFLITRSRLFPGILQQLIVRPDNCFALPMRERPGFEINRLSLITDVHSKHESRVPGRDVRSIFLSEASTLGSPRSKTKCPPKQKIKNLKIVKL